MNALDQVWGVDFVADDGIGGFVRLARAGDRCWYWCYVVGSDVGLVAVRDHDVVPPRRPNVLEIRADSLWAELVCETPDEHWGIALEAFGVRLDAPLDSWTNEIGERVAIGLDLEWEVDATGAPHGIVHGEVLLERDRWALDGHGVLTTAAAPDTAWPSVWSGWCRFADGEWAAIVGGSGTTDEAGISVPGEVTLDDGATARCEPRAVVPVPLGGGPGRGPALVRVLTGIVPAGGEPAMMGIGWLEVLQS